MDMGAAGKGVTALARSDSGIETRAVSHLCGVNTTGLDLNSINQGACASTFRQWYKDGSSPSLAACVQHCIKCRHSGVQGGCRYATFSLAHLDCSLYRTCDLLAPGKTHGYQTIDIESTPRLLTRNTLPPEPAMPPPTQCRPATRTSPADHNIWGIDRTQSPHLLLESTPKAGTTQANTLLLENLGLIEAARLWVRPYRCDLWDCVRHWENDYYFNDLLRRLNVPRSPCSMCTAQHRKKVACVKIVRWPLERAVSSYLYAMSEGQNQLLRRWPAFHQTKDKSFEDFVRALELGTSPDGESNHILPQASACDADHEGDNQHNRTEKIYLPLETLDISRAHLAANDNITLGRVRRGTAAPSGTQYRKQVNTTRTWKADIPLAQWSYADIRFYFGGDTQSPPYEDFLVDPQLVARLECLFQDDLTLYRKMCRQLSHRCGPPCMPRQCEHVEYKDLLNSREDIKTHRAQSSVRNQHGVHGALL